MSLKTFHIVFVVLSTLLSLGFGLWAALEYIDRRGIELLAVAIGSLVFSGLLVMYGIWFLRKLKHVSYF